MKLFIDKDQGMYRRKLSCIKKEIKCNTQIGKHSPHDQATLAKVRHGATDRTASLRRVEKHPRQTERKRKEMKEKKRAV